MGNPVYPNVIRKDRSKVERSNHWVLVESTSVDGFVITAIADSKEEADDMMRRWMDSNKKSHESICETIGKTKIDIYNDCSMASMEITCANGKGYTCYWTVQRPCVDKE